MYMYIHTYVQLSENNQKEIIPYSLYVHTQKHCVNKRINRINMFVCVFYRCYTNTHIYIYIYIYIYICRYTYLVCIYIYMYTHRM